MAMRNGDAGDVVVRPATREDMPAVHKMILKLAAYEGIPEGPELGITELTEDGFEAEPAWFFALVAERRGELLAYALCNRIYSSYSRRAFYVEDLYVVPSARRAGVGRLLLQYLCQMAVEAGVRRVDWHVLESNAAARALYSRLGARDLRLNEGRAALRLDAERIRDVAAGKFDS